MTETATTSSNTRKNYQVKFKEKIEKRIKSIRIAGAKTGSSTIIIIKIINKNHELSSWSPVPYNIANYKLHHLYISYSRLHVEYLSLIHI